MKETVKQKTLAAAVQNMSLPQDQAEFTDEQVEALLACYVSLGIKELRLRQGFNAQYFDMLRDQEKREGSSHRIERARTNLAVDADLLMEAVGRVTWPTEWHNSAEYIMHNFRGVES